VVADHHQDDDYTPYAYMTTDYGKTWKRITGDLPVQASWTHVIREDPRNRNLLYLGTEMGVWASWDRGAHWRSIRGELPVTPVRDIQIHPRDNDLLLATHGRGLYILDDITHLQQAEPASDADVALFDIRPAVRWSQWARDGNLGQKIWAGENPPQGALITYRLKSQPAGEVNVTITDQQGRVVRRMKRVADDAGINRINWDLRREPPPSPTPARAPGAPAPDTSLAGARARRAAAAEAQSFEDEYVARYFPNVGPPVLPGTYTVSLEVGGKTYRKPVQVELDPRSDMTQAQLVAQVDASTRMVELTGQVNRIVATTDNVLLQLNRLQEQLQRPAADGNTGAQGGEAVASAANPQVLAEVAGALKELRHFRDSVLVRPLPGLGYRQYPRLRDEIQTVTGMIARPMMPPTAGETLRMNELGTEVNEAQARLDGILQGRIAGINRALSGTAHIVTPARTLIP
jgi:hypothetical protein